MNRRSQRRIQKARLRGRGLGAEGCSGCQRGRHRDANSWRPCTGSLRHVLFMPKVGATLGTHAACIRSSNADVPLQNELLC